MNQPLGRMVGNAVEVNESVAALEGRGPDDLMEVTLTLGAELLVSTGRAQSLAQARADLQQTIDSGAAREKFARMVAAQGGDLETPRLVAPPQECNQPSRRLRNPHQRRAVGAGDHRHEGRPPATGRSASIIPPAWKCWCGWGNRLQRANRWSGCSCPLTSLPK